MVHLECIIDCVRFLEYGRLKTCVRAVCEASRTPSQTAALGEMLSDTTLPTSVQRLGVFGPSVAPVNLYLLIESPLHLK